MSNIVLQPNSSGTGSITIATPNTNTDRTLNIPDVAGDIVTTGDTGTVSDTMLSTPHSYVKLATINATPVSANYEWNMNYSYNDYVLVIERITGSSSATGENLDVKFKLDGVLDDGLSTPYNVDNINLGSAAVRNANNTDNMEWVTTNTPSKEWRGTIHCVNFGINGKPLMTGCLAGTTTNNLASFQSSNDYENSGKQVTAMRIAFTAGTVDVVKMKIYGVKA